METSHMKLKILAGVMTGLFLGSAAFAQQAAPSAPEGDRMQQRAAKLEQRFKAADANGDGALTRDEAAKMPGLEKHFDRLDANKDGKITLEEMKAAQQRGHGGAGKQEKRGEHTAKFEERFKAADKDGDGALSKAEVEAAKMPRLAKDFDRIDSNKDGKITKDELRAAMKQLHEMRKQGKDSLEGPRK
jgi:Ca2+-binding EF-hand superfamily protein